MSNFIEDGYADIEMTINGVEAEYTIYFEYEYVPAQTSRYLGTSHQENEEFPEEHLFSGLVLENGGFLYGKEEEFATGVLLSMTEDL